MALPSSQPVTWLVCGDKLVRCVGSGACTWERASPCPVFPARPQVSSGFNLTLPSRLPTLLPACLAHQVPGVAGALSSLAVPAAPLKGQHHVPTLFGVKHGVPTRDVNVEKLCGATWRFHTHQVGEHVVTWVKRATWSTNHQVLLS